MRPSPAQPPDASCERGLLLGAGGWAAAPAGCSSPETRPPDRTPTTAASPTPDRRRHDSDRRILLAYFSRPGENYYYGGRRDLEVGNTEVLARMIAELIDCDVYRIEATDPYPDELRRHRRPQRRRAEHRRPTRDRRSRWPRSTATTPCCWAARSGTSDPR